ncbi:MAG: glutamyl-tRNA reductase [Desulfobacterales bacterium]|nr:glutamyl-tRNA reductase [Desulfobacterales bacterium]
MPKLDIVLVGLNHKTAPVSVRECLAFSKEETISTLKTLQDFDHIHETFLLSTCNRVEFLMASTDIEQTVKCLKDFIAQSKNISLNKFDTSLYVHEKDEAVRHLFRVAASLDSLVVGEPQILGQIKDAYLTATEKKTSGVILNRLLHRTFFVAKRVRTETGIGDHAVSISYAAIELARKIFGDLEDKKIMLVGAGEMAELAVEHLIRHHAGDIFVANRTFENGVAMAKRFKGTPIRMEEISEYLKVADIIISSTGAPGFVIERKDVKGVMRSRKNRPIFFIDIAVPRDIDPDINKANNAYVYDIDDLKGVIEENMEDRNKEALKGERIIDEAVIHFRQWYESLDVVPTIVALREKIDDLVKLEIDKTLKGLPHLKHSDTEALSRMSDALINKIMHHPTRFLKSDRCRGNKSIYLDMTRKLFKLDD